MNRCNHRHQQQAEEADRLEPKGKGAGRETQWSPARTASPRWKDGIYVVLLVNVRNGVSPLSSSRNEVIPP